MEEEFRLGDTVDLMNIHSEKYRHSKGFFISNDKWGVNETIEILTCRRFTESHHIGEDYKSMQMCACRMVLTEKILQKT